MEFKIISQNGSVLSLTPLHLPFKLMKEKSVGFNVQIRTEMATSYHKHPCNYPLMILMNPTRDTTSMIHEVKNNHAKIPSRMDLM